MKTSINTGNLYYLNLQGVRGISETYQSKTKINFSDFVSVRLIENPFLSGSFDNPHYQAKAIDLEMNIYLLVFEILPQYMLEENESLLPNLDTPIYYKI